MAKKEPKNALARLVPNSLFIKTDDGESIVVATTAAENSILNMVMASQLRARLQDAMKKWKDMDTVPTPKEMKDMAEAASIIAKFSGEVYAKGDTVSEPKDEKNVTESVEDVSFDEPVVTTPAE